MSQKNPFKKLYTFFNGFLRILSLTIKSLLMLIGEKRKNDYKKN